jgi:hypothetical protein
MMRDWSVLIVVMAIVILVPAVLLELLEGNRAERRRKE